MIGGIHFQAVLVHQGNATNAEVGDLDLVQHVIEHAHPIRQGARLLVIGLLDCSAGGDDGHVEGAHDGENREISGPGE